MLSSTQFHIHEFQGKYRAEFCSEAGFLIIQTGLWRDSFDEAEQDRQAMMKAEMGDNYRPEIEFF